jgi:hypothetical protein
MIGLKDNRYRRLPQPLSAEGLRQRRDRAREEAQWEVMLRVVAAGPTPSRAPAAPASASVRTLLEVVDAMNRYDNLVMPRTLPLATGTDDEDLACGGCGATIASHIGREAMRRAHPQGDRLVIRCTCRALNVICGGAGRRNRLYFRQRMPLKRRPRA